MARPTAARPPRPDGGRRRASHSMEAVLTEAVALLDADGVGALTFRALAARLGGGVGSIYWYVASKDELLDRAADHVLADVLQRLAGLDDPGDHGDPGDPGDPVDRVRTIAHTLFDAVAHRPWLGAYFMRDTGVQPHGLRLFELLGEQVLQLDLTPRQRFHAVSAVVGFVVGTAADMGQQQRADVGGASGGDGGPGRDPLLAETVAAWRDLDGEEYPFLHHIAEEFAVHDDAEQFRAGLELILAGLRLQAGLRSPAGGPADPGAR